MNLVTIALAGALGVGSPMPSLADFEPEPGEVISCNPLAKVTGEKETIIVARPYRFWHDIAAVAYTVRGDARPYALWWVDGTVFIDSDRDGRIDRILRQQRAVDGCALAPEE